MGKNCSPAKKGQSWDEWIAPFKKIAIKNDTCKEEWLKKIDTDTTTHYYYARSSPQHTILYPNKPEGHFYWRADMFLGRISTLREIALTEEQKKNKDKLIQEPNHQGTIYYAIPGKSSSFHYVLRSQPKSQGRNSPLKEFNGQPLFWGELLNPQESTPVQFTEIEGIVINKDIYEYLFFKCERAEHFCHLNDYEGLVTKEQQNYIQKVKWDTDKR